METRHTGAGRVDLSKRVFYVIVTCGLLGSTFAWGLHAGANNAPVYQLTTNLTRIVTDALGLTMREASTRLGISPTHFLQPSRTDGSGVTINDTSNNPEDLILISSFFGRSNELRLIFRSGKIVARWPVAYYDLFGEDSPFPPDRSPATDWNVDTHGALALPDGSVVFNFEWGGLVKLDRCGNLVWKVARRTHHSVERAEGGGFWVAGRRRVESASPFPELEPPFEEDTILRISEDGRVLGEMSVPGILYNNGLGWLLTATAASFRPWMTPWEREVVHLNKIGELGSDLAAGFPMFAAGDLLLSIRSLNLVMVVGHDGVGVKWWKVGPWVRQHDPEFRVGGTILVFNNNIFETVFGGSDQVTPASTPRVSNILEVDPASGETRVVFGGRPGQEFLSVIRGKIDLTPRGGLLITEEDGGRLLETAADGRVVWEYVNRYSGREVAEITEARLYPSSYFTVNDWSCGDVGR